MNKIKNKKSTLLSIIGMVFIGIIGLTGCSFATNDEAKNDTEPKEVVNPNVVTEPDQGASEPYFGEWIINQVQAYGIGTYSREDAESLIGKTLIFTAIKASYFGDQPSAIEKVAINPIYTETIISESDFVEQNRIPFDLLGIKAPITEINVSDSNGHVATFFIKDDNTLIITGGGTYFELIRKGTKNQ
ncbi:hypothetical protein QTL97_10920 [Sporosarcina thermotolerans]|uniref:DUF4309 domain-containing protein n=1 Tax=Sporosarcina thermotolerans TaxID=633404 RepID=A0AAW9ACS1_9BACL|nr:hypothetical protein [Sporosarcina thermotolerans]MDW0117448.1 hypothetical protein [Sporosarcina thermotolerans]WHT49626.1 hypothetical protein QNH10_09050 [Sporosarcina thermotolerans]